MIVNCPIIFTVTFHPGDVRMGAARWQTTECDRIPFQENMISQFDMEYWWKIWKQKLD